MFNYIMYLSLIFIFFSCLMCSFFYKHILLILISFEFLMLSGMSLLYNMYMYMGMDILFIYLYLVIMICDSVMGVTILILMVRKSGNDYYKSMNLMNL